MCRTSTQGTRNIQTQRDVEGIEMNDDLAPIYGIRNGLLLALLLWGLLFLLWEQADCAFEWTDTCTEGSERP